MSTSVTDLIAQRDALDRQIREVQSTAKADAVAQVRKLMTEHGLSAADLVVTVKAKTGARAGAKVAAKYRDPVTGSTWTGRGLKPKWMKAAIEGGKSVENFLI
jgi:DNA-binding protein H-NS